MKYKNYYKILGLNSPKVTEDEIRSAYRKLAKKYHPDINPGNLQASEMFKDINEAYQILADEEARRKYNMKYFAYSFKDKISVKNIKDKIDDSGTSEFIEMFIGKQNVSKSSKNTTKVGIKGEDIESEINITLEEAFNGSNKKIAFKGYDDKMKNITVKVPRGIVNGGKIRIKGQGKPSKNAESIGDLFLKINILENKRFKLEKKDLIMELPLTPSEAVLGCQLNIEGIDSMLDLNINPGTETGETICIKEKGYFDEHGKRGDLIVKIKIVVPKEVSEQEKELYEKLQKITSFVPR